MVLHIVDSTYRQFYVADGGLDPDAPEDWTDDDVKQRFNALDHIVALCPEGNGTARVLYFAPGDTYDGPDKPCFEVNTQVSIPTGRLGVYGWPREPLEEYDVEPGAYRIRFLGFLLDAVDSEQDYYVVEFERM